MKFFLKIENFCIFRLTFEITTKKIASWPDFTEKIQILLEKNLHVKFYELALVSFTNPGSRIFQCFFIYTQHENQGIFCLDYLILWIKSEYRNLLNTSKSQSNVLTWILALNKIESLKNSMNFKMRESK